MTYYNLHKQNMFYVNIHDVIPVGLNLMVDVIIYKIQITIKLKDE